MGLFGGNAAADESKREAQQAQADEAARQGRITDGTNRINDTFGQFNDNYYNGIKQGYLEYANPQLSDQYNTARKALTFSLDCSGMLDSSTRG